MAQELANALLPCLQTESRHPVCIDATVGIGGHAQYILSKNKRLTLLANDIDPVLLSIAKETLRPYGDRVRFYNHWFDDFFQNLSLEKDGADAIFFDLGLSMYHFTHAGRGFSWKADEALDMRLNVKDVLNAQNILNELDEKDLCTIMYEYGEERQAAKWAGRIVRFRQERKIFSTRDLREALELGKKPQDRKILARIFQALRIRVNGELDRIHRALPMAWKLLRPGARLAVISFHSLEDRIVKHFGAFVQGKLKKQIFFPNMSMGDWNSGTALFKKPLIPSEEEQSANRASRSAKMRVIEKSK